MPQTPEIGSTWTDGTNLVVVNEVRTGDAFGKTPKKWGAWTLTRKEWVGRESADDALLNALQPIEVFLHYYKPVA